MAACALTIAFAVPASAATSYPGSIVCSSPRVAYVNSHAASSTGTVNHGYYVGGRWIHQYWHQSQGANVLRTRTTVTTWLQLQSTSVTATVIHSAQRGCML